MKKTVDTEQVISTPAAMKKETPLTAARKETVERGRDEIRSVLDGESRRMIIITGPCSIHDRYAALEYAQRLRKLQEKLGEKVLLVMRTYFEKPRSTVGWKGALYDPQMDGSCDMNRGIREARALLAEITDLGVLCATEILDPLTIPYLEDFLSYVAVGARTAESQIHRQAVSGISIAAGIKNSSDGNIKNAIDGVIAVAGRHSMLAVNDEGQLIMKSTGGNEYGHVILRGGAGMPNYSAADIEKVGELCDESMVDSAVVVDCSHQNSGKVHSNQLAVARTVIDDHVHGRSRHLRGIMLESNIHEGSQAITSHSEMRYGVSVTDACLGWEDTEELITELAERL